MYFNAVSKYLFDGVNVFIYLLCVRGLLVWHDSGGLSLL